MYVCKKWFRLLALIGLITLTFPLAVDTPTAYGNDGDNQLSIPEKAELKYPNLGPPSTRWPPESRREKARPGKPPRTPR